MATVENDDGFYQEQNGSQDLERRRAEVHVLIHSGVVEKGSAVFTPVSHLPVAHFAICVCLCCSSCLVLLDSRAKTDTLINSLKCAALLLLLTGADVDCSFLLYCEHDLNVAPCIPGCFEVPAGSGGPQSSQGKLIAHSDLPV
jgi:hypothetical protein